MVNNKSALRLYPWAIAAIALTIPVMFTAPELAWSLIWGLSRLCIGAYLGYWLDRELFPDLRPSDIPRSPPDSLKIKLHCTYRRAFIVGAMLIASALVLG